jgi:lipoprotein-anchoring transpeptidase ErfK/SrfK
VVGTAVALDPHPFADPGAPPALAVAAEPAISGSTATTMPATVTVPLAPGPGVAPAPDPVTPAPTTLPPPTVPPSAAPTTGAPAPSAPPARPPAVVAHLVTDVTPVYLQRDDAAPAFGLRSSTELGSPRVLLTAAVEGDRVEVFLPLRPNSSVGWVHAADVQLTTVDDLVDVDLAARTMTWMQGGRIVLQTTAGIGSPTTPTPTGTFFVTDVIGANPAEGRGRWIVALNGHSDAYDTFEGGDARIAIHGTSDPSSIGRAVSNGCVRIDDGPLDQLRAALPLGTPVVIH